MGVLVTLLVIAFIGWMVFVQIGARQQVDLVVNGSEQDVAEQVRGYFGALWTQVAGVGHLNFRPKLRARPPTLSVSFRPNGTASCEISVWTSAFTTRYGAMNHAQLAWRRKHALAARLNNLAAAPGGRVRGS
jgi:hypothetical protein